MDTREHIWRKDPLHKELHFGVKIKVSDFDPILMLGWLV